MKLGISLGFIFLTSFCALQAQTWSVPGNGANLSTTASIGITGTGSLPLKVFAGTSSDFQLYTGGSAAGNLRLVVLPNGNVGIGTATPGSNLAVTGVSNTNISVGNSSTAGRLGLATASCAGCFSDMAAIGDAIVRGWSTNAKLLFVNNGISATAGNVDAISFVTGTSGVNENIRMRIFANGNVAIGTPSEFTASTPFPNGYNLYISKGILSPKVRVAPQSSLDWADFVFEKDYKLKSIEEVESYIKKNNHLPDVPSSEEVKSKGIDLAAMDARLLQKIEELTLYVIAQQKQIKALEAEVRCK